MDGTDDRLIFAGNQTANLGFFSFNGGPAGAAGVALGNNLYEIVPAAVPEPSTWAWASLGSALLVAVRRRLRAACPA